MYSVSDLAAKVYRVQAGKFAAEESRHPELLCHITYGFSVQTCGLQTFVKGSEGKPPGEITLNASLPSVGYMLAFQWTVGLSYHSVSNLD